MESKPNFVSGPESFVLLWANLTLIEPESQKKQNMKVVFLPLGFPYQFEFTQYEFRGESYGQNTKECQICPEFCVFLKLSLSVSKSLCSRVSKYPSKYPYALFQYPNTFLSIRMGLPRILSMFPESTIQVLIPINAFNTLKY